MERPRFSEMLLNRRRELGLSVSQASRVLKLKESVLIAFEEGDFSSIPKSGYAQGMLSSYARYLGLNPREVVDQFSEDLYEYANGSASHELRRRTRQTRSGSSTSDLSATQHLGRTHRATGATGSLSSLTPDVEGDPHSFDTTSDVSSRTQAWMRASPLVNPRQERSSADLTTRLDRSELAREHDLETRRGAYAAEDYPQGHPYTTRVPEPQGNTDRTRRYAQRRTRTSATGRTARRPLPQGYRGDDITRRQVNTADYVDDLRLDEETQSSYEPASTRLGRENSRNIASTQRPQQQRYQANRQRRARSQVQSFEPAPSGFLGTLEVFFSDRRRLLMVVFAALAIFLLVLVIGSVRSCTAQRTTSTRRVAVTQVDKNDSSSDKDTSDATDEATDTSSDAASTTEDAAATTPATPVSVKVSLAEGEVSWLEIDCDGTSEVADTLTGPWEKTFTPAQSITIQAGEPSVVTVTKNGDKVSFASKASGLGTITIEGSQAQAADQAASQTTPEATS